MNRKIRIALVGLMVAGFVGAAASVASAAAGDGLCNRGYNCIYQDLSYQGWGPRFEDGVEVALGQLRLERQGDERLGERCLV